jgi:hypothetical protein
LILDGEPGAVHERAALFLLFKCQEALIDKDADRPEVGIAVGVSRPASWLQYLDSL